MSAPDCEQQGCNNNNTTTYYLSMEINIARPPITSPSFLKLLGIKNPRVISSSTTTSALRINNNNHDDDDDDLSNDD